MSRYTFGDILPLSGAGAPLLTASVAYVHPTTLTELAKAAGISKFAASRAAQSLTESRLMLTNGDGYAFNDDHPMAKTITELAWRFSGIRRARERDYRYDAGYDTSHEVNVEDFHYRRTVPESLQLGAERDPRPIQALGPDLVSVRDTCNWLANQVSLLRQFENDGQEVYSHWSNERLRDLVHQTLHLGGALRAAWTTLSAACSSEVQGDANPFEVAVTAHAWVRATYLVSAEARDLLRVIELLDTAIWVGSRVNTLRTDAVDGLGTINYLARKSEAIDSHLDAALKDQRAASELWIDPSHGPWHNFGGSPRPQDVGTAGDQIMAVRLLRAVKTVAAQVEQMAREQCVSEWVASNPAEATELPLVTSVPDGALRGHREWPKGVPTVGDGGDHRRR
jgi:hypothetical protein